MFDVDTISRGFGFLHLFGQHGHLEELSQRFRAMLGTLPTILFVQLLVEDETSQYRVTSHPIDLHKQYRNTVRHNEHDL